MGRILSGVGGEVEPWKLTNLENVDMNEWRDRKWSIRELKIRKLLQ